jgi:hypothetical protein
MKRFVLLVIVMTFIIAMVASPALAKPVGGTSGQHCSDQGDICAEGYGGGDPSEGGVSGCGGIYKGDDASAPSSGDFVAGGCGYHTDQTGGDGGRCVITGPGTQECVGLAEG